MPCSLIGQVDALVRPMKAACPYPIPKFSEWRADVYNHGQADLVPAYDGVKPSNQSESDTKLVGFPLIKIVDCK